ncbi:MAG: peptidoglycan DD-metalloendopeptidase family protein [Candidatus Cloacimonetes bacterium]|jgi:murein hydrolase activator|nr:peptidoglycan DD-metalloendopeptidase family protein [Candidatus Cloacimonadota bacterium]MBT6994627.1 peptidoglycan DD-metalloendopeptidase family protein [Candidatus Cloacimonadota bacterium]MBT7470124.1 peptidoglycan DD-metalloendopeptidase family protein [Candidatus Cloacimonadota bacterium]
MKIRLLLTMLFVVSLLFPQNLEEKKNQLGELKDKIDSEQKLIEETEQKKQNTKKNINLEQKKKKKSTKKIQKFEQKEKLTKNKLSNIKNNLTVTNSHLSDLQNICGKSFQQLAIAHYKSEIFPHQIIDGKLLSKILQITVEEIFMTKSEVGLLSQNISSTIQKIDNLTTSKKKEKNKKNKIAKKIKLLNSEVISCENTKNEAQKRKQNFEEEAAALNELITKLQVNTVHDYTYKFSTEKLIWPVEGDVIRDFGEQKCGDYKVTLNNDGIDIFTDEGAEVKVVADGVVAFAGLYGGAGKLVIIDHQNGFYSLYSHNSKLLVSKGDGVQMSQIIAHSGQTGSTEKPCLHFELRKRGTPVNPMDYLE